MRHRRTRIAALASALLVIAGGGARAGGSAPPDEPAGGDLSGLSLEDLMKIEIPDVYAASQFVQRVTDAPAAVTIVTREDIERFGYRTLGEILASVRGFYTSYDRNYSYLGTRGFSRPGDYNSRVLLLLDGHRLNDAVYESAEIGTEGILDVAMIERVEVVRGPSSSLYGTEAFFAVVNIVTRRGADLSGVRLSADAASFGTGAAGVSYGTSRPEGLDLLVSGSGYRSHGQRLFYPEFDAPATNGGIARDDDGDRYERLFARASFGSFDLEGGHSSRTKTIPTASFGTVFDDPRNETTDQWDFLDLHVTRAAGARTRVDGRLGWDWYRYHGTYVYDQPPIVLNEDGARGDSASLDVKVQTTALPRQVVVAGVDARYAYHQDQSNHDAAPYFEYLSSRRSGHTTAVFVQDEIAPAPWVTISAGVRYDHDSTFGGTANPRLALIFKPWENTAVKLLYGRAFRAPNAYELYYADGFTQKAPTGLDPETIRTYEAVFERFDRHGYRISASAFSYRIDDLIALEIDPSDGLQVFRNVDRVKSDGLEIEAGRTWSRGVDARVSYTLQRSEDASTGELLTNSPRHLAKLNVSSPLIRERLFAGLEVQYTSARTTLAGNEAHGFTVANFTLYTRRLLGGLDLSASVYNLLDTRYGDPGSEEHVQDVIEQDGRGWRVQLRYRF